MVRSLESAISAEVLVILILIVANGFFALTEMAVVSSRKSRLEQMAASGEKGAVRALELANDPSELLSAVQVGITLIGVLTGAFGGATLSAHLAGWLIMFGIPGRYADALSLAVVVSGITYFSLIAGELAPKRIALNNPERIAVLVSRPISVFVRANRPLVHLLGASTNLVLSLLRVKPPDNPPVTEEEVKVLIGQGAQYGVFEEAEREMIERVFHLGDMRVGAIMTPRPQIEWLDLEDDSEYNLEIITAANYSYYPVGRGSLDDLVGVAYTKDLLATHIAGDPVDLARAARDPLYVPENVTALKLLNRFKAESIQIAFVIDEFGGLAGIVTLHDILSHIVGDIAGPDDTPDPDVVRRADGSWLIDGMISVEEFKDLFGLDELPGEHREQYHTLAGFIISYLDRIPAVPERFNWNGLSFEIVDMDRTRIDKVLVAKAGPPPDGERRT